MVRKDEIKTFTYWGSDDMIDFGSDDIPRVHRDFKATLKLKNGTVIPATRYWRRKIWEWWYIERKQEIKNAMLLNTTRKMVRTMGYRR